MTCKWRGINHHRTYDAVSPAAVKTLQVGRFPADHSAVCNCAASNGKMKPEDCDGLCVYDSDNAEVARFTGKQFRAHLAEDGAILVWSLPRATQDRDGRFCRDHSARLAGINESNAAFWARLNVEE